MAVGDLPVTPTTTSEEPKGHLASLHLAAQVAAVVLLVLGAAKLVTSILSFLAAPWLSFLGLLEGMLTVLLALILVKIATDLRYAREAPQLTTTHLIHAMDSWRDFCKTLIAIAVLAFLGALARY
jgi:hypothetical protein